MIRLTTIVLLLVLGAANGWSQTDAPPPGIAFSVNGLSMTETELERQANREFRRLLNTFPPGPGSELTDSLRALRSRIEREIAAKTIMRFLLLSAAQAEGLRISDEIVNRVWQEAASKNGGEERFTDMLRAAGITPARYKESQREEMMIDRYVAIRTVDLVVSDSDAMRFYNENKGQFRVPEKIRTRHILIRDTENAKARIEEIREMIIEGANMADLARQYSEDGSAPKGGDLGFRSRNELYPSYAETAFSMPDGIISESFRTEAGWHLLRVEGRRPERDATFREVGDKIVELIFKKMQAERMDHVLQELTDKADIRIRAKSH